MTEFLVRVPGPLDAAASLERFRRWGDDMLERWDGRRFLTTAPLDPPIAFVAQPAGTVRAPTFLVTLEDGALPRASAGVRRHVVGLFAAAPPGSLDAAAAADPVVRGLVVRYGGVRPVLQRDVLTALIRSISAQQVNLSWAATTRRRLAEAFGREHRVAGELVFSLPTERLAAADPGDLRVLQFTGAKSRAIVEAARAVVGGGFDLTTLDALPDEAVIGRLVALPGIGPWTAEWFLARTLGRPRVVAGDLGVRKAVGSAYLGRSDRDLPSESEVRSIAEQWGPAAGIVQQLLLEWLGDGRPQILPARRPA